MRATFAIARICLAVGIVMGALAGSVAGETPAHSEIGRHQRILTVHKNVNPQNTLVVYTKVDAHGRFLAEEGDGSQPILDFYWLMNGRDYKPVHHRIEREIRKRFDCQSQLAAGATHFVVTIEDLKEVNTDIADPKMDIHARGAGAEASAEAHMSLGPSDGFMRIRLTSIHTEGRVFPPRVYSVTVKGEELVDGKPTGRKVARRYEGKAVSEARTSAIRPAR